MSKFIRPAHAVPVWAKDFSPEQLGRVLRSPEAAKFLGISRTTLWRYEREGRVPPALRLSERAKGWRMADLLAAFAEGGAA